MEISSSNKAVLLADINNAINIYYGLICAKQFTGIFVLILTAIM